MNHSGLPHTYLTRLAQARLTSQLVLAVTMLLFTAALSAADGGFDPTFASGGREAFAIDGSGLDSAAVVRETKDGKLLLAGTCGSGSYACLARLRPDGSLDPDYGPLGLGYARFDEFSSSYQRTSIADMILLPDGRAAVLTCGTVGYGSIFIILADGTGLDTTAGNGFGSIGASGSFQPIGCPVRIRQQTDGKFVVVQAGGVSGYGSAMMVSRFAADLSGMDNAFGTNGVAVVAFGLYGASGNSDEPAGLAIQTDGKIVIGGNGWLPSARYTIEFARLLANGQRDDSFGGNGDGRIHYVESDVIESWLTDLTLDAQQRTVFCGNFTNIPTSLMMLGRLTNGGEFDSMFNGGIATYEFSTSGSQEVVSVAVTSDSVIALGQVPRTADGDTDYFDVMRVDMTGQKVASFGGGGSSYASFAATDSDSPGNAVLVTSRGIVVAGTSSQSSSESFGVARLQYEHIFGDSFE